MRSFLVKTFLFILGAGILIFLSSLIFSNTLLNIIWPESNEIQDKKGLFIWGDSQVYRGIDLEVLEKKNNVTIYSSAIHGAGVYDFLIFTEKVPKNSRVIIALSRPTQIRPKQLDYNRSGLSLSALEILYTNNYRFSELNQIIQNNKSIVNIFKNRSELFKYNDSIVYLEPMSRLIKAHKQIPDFLLDKQEIYLTGIKNLNSKGCNIIFMEFPYHPNLAKLEAKSKIKKETEKFKQKVFHLYSKIKLDSLDLNNDRQKMHDLTHLNQEGAKEVSIFLSPILKQNEKARFIKVKY
jgi:hypothetical protein